MRYIRSAVAADPLSLCQHSSFTISRIARSAAHRRSLFITAQTENRARIQSRNSISQRRGQYRNQHDSQGPHKEYFQTPGHAPPPDLSPYQRSQSTSFPPPPYPGNAPTQYQTPTQFTPTSETPAPKSKSLLRRAIKSILWTALFGYLGIMAGAALVTWEYMSPLPEEGSDEEAELLDGIYDLMDEHPLIFGLQEDGWREVDMDINTNPGVLGTDGQQLAKGRSMLYQGLTGTKGLVGMRIFHHATEEYSVMVFFTGFGIEGWVEVVHGGMVTTLLEEAVQKHVEYFHGADRGTIEQNGGVNVKVDFKRPVKPGEIYAVLIPPASRDEVVSHENVMSPVPSMGTGVDRLKMVALFMQLDGAPKVSSNIQAGSNTIEHKIEIPSIKKRDGNDVNAIAEITMKVPGHRSQLGFLEDIEKSNAEAFGKRRNSSEVGNDE